jgi:hypothetical protein
VCQAAAALAIAHERTAQGAYLATLQTLGGALYAGNPMREEASTALRACARMSAQGGECPVVRTLVSLLGSRGAEEASLPLLQVLIWEGHLAIISVLTHLRVQHAAHNAAVLELALYNPVPACCQAAHHGGEEGGQGQDQDCIPDGARAPKRRGSVGLLNSEVHETRQIAVEVLGLLLHATGRAGTAAGADADRRRDSARLLLTQLSSDEHYAVRRRACKVLSSVLKEEHGRERAWHKALADAQRVLNNASHAAYSSRCDANATLAQKALRLPHKKGDHHQDSWLHLLPSECPLFHGFLVGAGTSTGEQARQRESPGRLSDRGSVSVVDSAEDSDGSVGVASLVQHMLQQAARDCEDMDVSPASSHRSQLAINDSGSSSSSSCSMGGGSSSSRSAIPSAQLKTRDSGTECARGVAEGGRDGAEYVSWVRLLGLVLPRLLPERESSFACVCVGVCVYCGFPRIRTRACTQRVSMCVPRFGRSRHVGTCVCVCVCARALSLSHV